MIEMIYMKSSAVLPGISMIHDIRVCKDVSIVTAELPCTSIWPLIHDIRVCKDVSMVTAELPGTSIWPLIHD